MTYGELKNRILSLGFETADEYEEAPDIICNAANFAMREITGRFPLVGSYTIHQEPSTEDEPRYRRYDFKELTREQDGTAVFIDFLELVTEDGGYQRTRDFVVERRHVLVLDGLKKLDCTMLYSKNFVPFTLLTPDNREIELDFDKEHLLPLLSAWYVWADDEQAKAAKWKNDYEDGVARLLSEAKPGTATERFTNSSGW